MSIDDRIFTGWRLPFMPHSEQTGHALSRELIEKEQRFGLTAQVAWAYADAFPALVHAPSPERVPNLHPLHCSKGLLRAAIIHHDARDEDAILALPALDYVQTSSPQVCRLMAGRVRTFHVDNRDALETLKHHHQGISHVYAWQIDPAEDDQRSPFSITHIPRASPHQYTPQLPTWYAPTRHSEELIPLCKFDLDVWLCWSLYERRACLIEGRSRRLSRVNAGPADVVPARASRPWMTPHQLDTFAGRGWAATARYTDQRTERLIDATTERRWLLLSCFERTTYNDDLIQAWRARRPLDAIPDAPDFAQATMASISLDEKSIEYSWIGTHRVLRLRDNTLTQLTEDHDLLYHARQEGQTLDEAQRAQYAQLENIVVKVIPRHAPDSGTCDLRPGDRFILLEKVAQNILAQHLQGHLSLEKFFSMGSPHDVAQRALNILDRALPHNPYIVLIVDSDAQVLEDPDKYKRLQATQLAQAQPPTRSPTVRDLVESPAEYDGHAVHTRGILSWGIERNRFAGAWFEPTARPELRTGSWLVEMRGTWHCDGAQYGHFGMSKSLIRGEVQLISIDAPQAPRNDHIFQIPPYTPFKATVLLSRHLTGWTCRGKWLNRLGADCRLPAPHIPDQCRAEIVYVVDQFGAVGIFSWTILEEIEIKPKITSPAHLIDVAEKGDFIETTGLLTPHESDRDLSDWPRLRDSVRVVLPAYSRTGDRHVIPNKTMLRKALETLGKSGQIVKIRGEIAHSYRDIAHKEVRPDGTTTYRHETVTFNILYATHIFNANGMLLDL